MEQLTEGEYDVREFAVHPGGESVEFISNRDEYADLTWFRYIYSLNLENKAVSTLFNGEDNGVGNMSRLGWSPNGSRLAFTGRPMESMDYVEYRNQELYVVDGEGNLSNPTAALNRRIGVSPGIQWSGDSKWVSFTKPEAGSRHLCRANVDGVIETLVEGELNVAGFSVGEGSIVLNYTDMNHPSELYTLKEGELSKETRMSSVPEGFVAPEEFWFTASDGVEIPGWIVQSRDIKAGEKYSAVLHIHGGPRVHFEYMYQGIEHEFQVLSDHGFAVVFINPRGSIGYDQEFSGMIQGNWGDWDYNDLMEAMDHVIENFDYVDGERLGVCGGSYAGYMTNWIVGQTDRFRASIAIRSISNWISMSGTSCVDLELGYLQHDLSGVNRCGRTLITYGTGAR